ncbi:hypothetical protein DL93DRAFT_2052832, partial [Clavulina sp. PMI_390]
KEKSPYTILLVGETGVGKSAVLQFMANVLKGNAVFNYDLSILDLNNEEGGSQSSSQTKAARLYKLMSNNGIEVNILDTPGLADTRGLQRDELHKKSIATQIENHVTSVNAVIVLANGTIPRITTSTDYALTTLSALFPKTLATNIAFLFTNVSNPLAWNFSQDGVPEALEDAPQYLFDNPVARQKKYDELKQQPKNKKILSDLKKLVYAGEQAALETLGEIFDWLDGLTPQPVSSIIDLYEKSQQIEQQISNTLARMDQAAKKKNEVAEIMSSIENGTTTMDAYAKYEQTVETLVWKQQESPFHNTLCSEMGCYSNCHKECKLPFSLNPNRMKRCKSMKGDTCLHCNHSIMRHSHYRVLWEQVPDAQVTVDKEMMKKWQNAKEGKERDDAILEGMQSTLDKLTQSIEQHVKELADLARDYAKLSLSGSFSAQVAKAINLLEMRLETMRNSGIEKEQLDKVNASLEEMKKKLELLKVADKKSPKNLEIVKAGRAAVNRVKRDGGWGMRSMNLNT